MQQRQSGFTLIELLIVVLIIGILASIAIPVFNGQRNKAKEAASKTYVRQALTAFASFRAGNNDTMVGSPFEVTNLATATNAELAKEEAIFANRADLTATPGSGADPKKIWFGAFSPAGSSDIFERGEVAFACSASQGKYAFCGVMAWGNIKTAPSYLQCPGCTVKDGTYFSKTTGTLQETYDNLIGQQVGLIPKTSENNW